MIYMQVQMIISVSFRNKKNHQPIFERFKNQVVKQQTTIAYTQTYYQQQ